MPSLNQVNLIGNLTREPETRYTPNGTAVCDIGLAINRRYKGQEETVFVDIVLWSALAELADKYLSKGSPVYIGGRLQLDTWDDKSTGQKRSKMRVVAENMQFLGSNQDGARSQSVTARDQPADKSQLVHRETTPQEEGSIPF